MKFLLGNGAPIEVHKLELDSKGAVKDAQHPHVRGRTQDNWQGRGPHRIHSLDVDVANLTNVEVPDDKPLSAALTELEHAWEFHSTQPPGFVLSVIEEGDEPSPRQEMVRRALLDHWNIVEPGDDVIKALVTNAGLDFASKQLSGAASATAVAKWVAVTANSTSPAAGDTTLTAEIVTGGGGLVRATATYAHTTSASTYTLSITLTANGSDTLPVTLAKAGIFDAASSGNMVFEDLISPTITLSASGDAATLTETVTV